MSLSTPLFSPDSALTSVPAIVVASQFMLGSIMRLSPHIAPKVYSDLIQKTSQTAPTLYPVIPFRGDTEDSVRNHMRWLGACMGATAVLLFRKESRGSKGTLGMVLFCTGALGWSHWKCGFNWMLPAANAVLGFGIYAIEMWKRGQLPSGLGKQ